MSRKRTISQTPAPLKDRIKGSKKNVVGSSKDLESAKSIVFDEKTLNAVESKVKSHNAKYPQKKITLSTAKAVVRRGMGAYSGSHRPTIRGGKPNSRVAWGLARLNAFLYKIINGESKSGKYSQDNDLINELGYKVSKYNEGGNVGDLISKGIVELKMFDTKPEHAKEYGFDVKKPLYIQSICISENERLKGIGKKVLDYIDEYAVKNGHDLIFGHITQTANFTKDSRHTDLCDIDFIKEFLMKGGYNTIEGNNDFYKVIKNNPDIRFMAGGNVDDFETETRNLIAVLKKAVLLETGEERAETERLIKELESELTLKPRRTPSGDVIFEDAWLITRDEYNKQNLIMHLPKGAKPDKESIKLQHYYSQITNRQHAGKVRDAIENGLYAKAIRNGKMTRERANEIIKSADLKKRFDGGGLTEKPDTKRDLTRTEAEALQRSVKDPLLSPRLRESFQKLLDSRKIDEHVDFSRFPEGKYIDPYNFSGYEYMRQQNEEHGVSFLLTGEYELVSKAIYERDYPMWLFYNYTARINISLENARKWVKEAQDHFKDVMPIPLKLRHTPEAKDGRSYASWIKGDIGVLERWGFDPTFEYNGNYYGNYISMVGNKDKPDKIIWGEMYPEKKTGLFLPEFTETSFHFNTVMHEFAHCLDFQSQLVNNIKKFKERKEKSRERDISINTEEMTDVEKALYGNIIREEDSVTSPITNHFDFFIDSLIKVLRASSGGYIPLTQKFEQQALDVQIALAGLYGDILLEQRERKKAQAKETAVIDEDRENKRFTWQAKRLPLFVEYLGKKGMQREVAEDFKKPKSGRKISLSEALEIDTLISRFADEYINEYAVRYPEKIDTFYESLKEMKGEANRLIANHYDNIKRKYQFGFYPVTELDKYLSFNCRVDDFRDYKSWKQCNSENLFNKIG